MNPILYTSRYEALDGGKTSLALMIMTGCEDLRLYDLDGASGKWVYSKYRPDREQSVFKAGLVSIIKDEEVTPDDLWNIVSAYDDQNYIMSCSISGNEIERQRSDGLLERHAYALIAATEVAGFRMVCARNPWGDDQEW